MHARPFYPAAGFAGFQARAIGVRVGIERAQIAAIRKMAHALYRLYLERDASLVEVNPLIVPDGDLLALDARSTSKTTACPAQGPAAMRDDSQEDPMERGGGTDLKIVARREYRLHGECAGLAMAHGPHQLHGGKPRISWMWAAGGHQGRVAERSN